MRRAVSLLQLSYLSTLVLKPSFSRCLSLHNHQSHPQALLLEYGCVPLFLVSFNSSAGWMLTTVAKIVTAAHRDL